MRKIKSTALLGAFVAVASVGAISHEAHGTQVTSVINNIPKEMLPGSVTLPAPLVTPSVNYPSNAQITLTLNGASFVNTYSYTILGSSTYCPVTVSNGSVSSVTFKNCALSANNSYTITGGPHAISSSSIVLSGSQNTSTISLSYSSNVGNDTSSSVALAQVQQQLTVTPAYVTTAFIDPSSLSKFTNGATSAINSVVISNSAYNNSTWSNTIGSNNASYTMNFLFGNIPGSVSLVSATDYTNNTFVSATPGNASATVSATLANSTSPLASASDTIYFSFSNYSNSSIQTGTILLSSITGIGPNEGSVSYVYSSTPQPFLSFSIGGTQIYVPDALAPYNGNVIQAGYITISMPSSASIASVSVLNNPNASCSTPSTANGLLTPLQNNGVNTGVYVIDLREFAQSCTGLTAGEWQAGVPLVIYISGSNATPTQITADAYAVYNNGVNNGGLKRIPVNVVNSSNVNANTQFSY